MLQAQITSSTNLMEALLYFAFPGYLSKRGVPPSAVAAAELERAATHRPIDPKSNRRLQTSAAP